MRLSRDLVEAVRLCAKWNRRSLSAELRDALWMHVQSHRDELADPNELIDPNNERGGIRPREVPAPALALIAALDTALQGEER